MLAILLIGCGSDDSSTTTIVPSPTPALNGNSYGYGNSDINRTTNSSVNNNLKIGYFLDATVSGAKYSTTSGLKGFTDKYGRFQYQDNDSVTVSIGNLILLNGIS